MTIFLLFAYIHSRRKGKEKNDRLILFTLFTLLIGTLLRGRRRNLLLGITSLLALALFTVEYSFPFLIKQVYTDRAGRYVDMAFVYSFILVFFGYCTVAMTTEFDRERLKVLEKSQEFNTILETSTVGIALITERKLLWLNRRAGELTGYRLEELKGQTLEIIYAFPEDYQKIGSEGYPVIAQGRTYSIEAQLKKKSGEIFWVISDNYKSV